MAVRSAIQEIVVCGLLVSHKRVVRLMREGNLLAVQPRAFVVTTDSDHEWEVVLNLAFRLTLTGMTQAEATEAG
jgi:hypothetical protein